MPLAPGIRLGPHEIVAPLGAGGMGEVYKARDTRLNRTVAIKVLPAHLKDDPHLRQRFLREAQAVAALDLGPDGMLFAVDIDRTNIEAGVPRPLFRAPVDPDSHDTEQYATVDGKRFLVMKPIERPQRSINVIINWPEAIRAQSRP